MPPDSEDESGKFAEVEAELDELAGGTDQEDEGGCGEACCDEEDPYTEVPATATTANAEESSVPTAAPVEEEVEKEESSASPKKKRQSRLEELAKPKPQPEEPVETTPAKPVKREKKAQSNRPSLLLRLRPTNLEAAWAAFEASGFQEAPKFTYAHSEEVVAKYFEENSNVCFELLPEAKRILQKVQDEYGGPEAFMQVLYGDRKIPAEEMRGIVAEYLKDHNIEDKVDIRLVDNMLSAANVIKPGADEKYVVNIANGPISWNMVQGICDHEVGTHLLRMMNDEHQVWHGIRDRYKLANPWTTEEGFATLNTYQSMPCRLMYPQALRYYAVCRGAQSGFVELFHELMTHTSDPKRCWQMCCRIKRGMIDTSLPGAFYLDQAYFKGAVEILRHLDEVDFGRLYGGQIALQDLDKVHFLLRKEVVRLPRFLNSAETLKTYKAHCRRLIKENQIEIAIEKVCKPVFIRTAREFFKPAKQKTQMNATIAIGEQGIHGKDARSASVGAPRPLDAERLADLARPRQLLAGETDALSSIAPPTQLREFDRVRVAELSLPRQRVAPEAPAENRNASKSRSLNLARLEDLAKPRQPQIEIDSEGAEQKIDAVERRDLDVQRLLALAMPRKADTESCSELGATTRAARKSSRPRRRRTSSLTGAEKQKVAENSGAEPINTDESTNDASLGISNSLDLWKDDVPPPPLAETPRSVDEERLAQLATPRKKCEEDPTVPCKCPPKAGGRRKRRSKLRILAMVQDREQISDDEAFVQNMHAESALDEAASEANPLQSLPRSDQWTHVMHVAEDQDVENDIASMPHKVVSVASEERASEMKPPSAESSPRAADRRPELVLRATTDEPCVQEMAGIRPEPKTRSRAVARVRSLSSGVPAVESRGIKASGQTADFGALVSGLGAHSPVSFHDPDFQVGGSSRRPRVPIGLPRGAAAAVTAAANRGNCMTGKGADTGPLWKAVPIKVMQFDFCGL